MSFYQASSSNYPQPEEQSQSERHEMPFAELRTQNTGFNDVEQLHNKTFHINDIFAAPQDTDINSLDRTNNILNAGIQQSSNNNHSENNSIIHDDESYTESDDDAPQSVQFETPLLPTHHVSDDNTRTFTRLNLLNPRTMFSANERVRPAQIRAKAPPAGITSWNKVTNLDEFLKRIYNYYRGRGALCIILAEATNLINLGFIVFLTSYVVSCIDYSLIHEKKRLVDVIIPQCTSHLSITMSIFLLCFILSWSIQAIKLLIEIPKLYEMQAFFKIVFHISDTQLDTLPWNDLVVKIIETRNEQSAGSVNDSSTGFQKLDAHVIANRILKRDNYMIALLNKEVFDLNVPILENGPVLTNLLEWNLNYCVFAFVFDSKGALKKRFLKVSNRIRLATQLKKRFQTMAIVYF